MMIGDRGAVCGCGVAVRGLRWWGCVEKLFLAAVLCCGGLFVYLWIWAFLSEVLIDCGIFTIFSILLLDSGVVIAIVEF